jgi:hypothetical protein
VLLAAIAAAPAAAAIDDPPGGLIPTSSTLAVVRSLYARAHEKERTRAATVIEDWRLSQDRMTGSYRVWRLGKDERNITSLGPMLYATGVHAGTHWQQTRNGFTYTFPGVHEQRDALSDRAFLGDVDEHDVRLIGESLALNAYVVEVDPPGGRHEWLFIDKNSGLISRREFVQKERRFATTYDDYRTFDGIPEPSRVKTIDSYGNEREQVLLSRTLDLTPDPHDVDIPPSRRQLVEFPAATNLVRLPIRLINGLIVTRVHIGSRGYDFLLDSGAAGIVVDPSVVDDQRLETYGAHVGATIGTFSESSCIVPAMQIGLLHMQHVVARVVTVPFHLENGLRITGLIGFDLFADTTVHVDLEHGIVEAIVPSAFRAPADAVALPLALDDRTPAVRAKLGSTSGRVVLDTGANRSVFTTEFATRADVALDPAAAVAHFRGMGGVGLAESVHARDFDLAGITLADPVIDVSDADLGAEDIDGTAGTDLLRAYDLFFDYHSQTVFMRRAGRAASGS